MKPSLPHIILGIGCDNTAWPETASAADAAVGAPVLGPHGLLRVVETALGLGLPEVAPAIRLAAWRAKLEASHAGRFWQDSLTQDPLTTAEELLRWRDALIEGGWRPEASGTSPRLLDLAAAEATGAPLPAGVADRLARAIGELTRGLTPIGQISLLDGRAGLPPAMARLVAALEASGAVVENVPEHISPALGDLGAVQGTLRLGGAATLKGDETFALLTAETETAAAEVLADWLAARRGEGRVIIIADQPTAALDAALARRHLPALGVSRASALRGVLQLLPLAIATRWRPFDAPRMLQLLQARPSPLPRELRHALTNALVQAPGRGGAGWISAMAQGMAAFGSRLAEEEAENPNRKAAARLKRGQERAATLIEAPLVDPDGGMAVDELRAICGLLASWAVEQSQTEAGPLFHALTAASRALAEAASASGRASLPRVELERLLAAALEPGLPDPDAEEQAAPWIVLRDPAAMWGFAEVVVWWGLGQPGLPERSPWNRAERTALTADGCLLPDAATRLATLSAGWRRPLLFARKQALLVAVPPAGDAHARRHPILDELRESLPTAPPGVRPQAELLLADPAPRLLGVTLARTSIAAAALPQARPVWTIPAASVARREMESASSIERLLGCSYAWVGQYAARLRPGRAAEIPQDQQLAGLLAHRLAQEIFQPGPPPAPGAAQTAAEQRLPALLGEMAAPFLAPGSAAEVARLRQDLPQAMRALAELLAKHGLSVIGAEAQREAADIPEPGQRFVGTLDLLLQSPGGQSAVLDLKWTRTDRYRRAEVREGRAVQLAAYVALVGARNDAAFFMLAQRRVIAPQGSIFAGGEGPALMTTWQDALAARQARMATLGAGTLRAQGVGWKEGDMDADGAALSCPPPCRVCEFGRLCGQELVR